MLQRIRDFFNTYLLVELWKGLWVTGGNMILSVFVLLTWFVTH